MLLKLVLVLIGRCFMDDRQKLFLLSKTVAKTLEQPRVRDKSTTNHQVRDGERERDKL